jgi:hypothetical protein
MFYFFLLKFQVGNFSGGRAGAVRGDAKVPSKRFILWPQLPTSDDRFADDELVYFG